MQPGADIIQYIARLSAHHNPPTNLIQGSSNLRRANCRAKGGSPGFKVAILGAAAGFGQLLAMLIKMNTLVSVLHLYNVVNTPGVTVDINHMDTGVMKICNALIGYTWLKFDIFTWWKSCGSKYD